MNTIKIMLVSTSNQKTFDIARLLIITIKNMKATNIKWDTDRAKLDYLPNEVNIPPETPEDKIADYLSDKYCWLVNSFNVIKSNDKEYTVSFIWSKYIDFPPIMAENKQEAEEKAEAILASGEDEFGNTIDLTEVDGKSKFIIIEKTHTIDFTNNRIKLLESIEDFLHQHTTITVDDYNSLVELSKES